MNSSASKLYLAPVGPKPSRYACEKWHYLASAPTGKCFHIGVWERGLFKGSVVFNRGNINIGMQFGLKQREIVHLARVALRQHDAPVSRILRIAVKILRETNPGLRLIRAYSWLGAGHHGGIYQASNWTYIGEVESAPYFRIGDEVLHSRTVGARYNTHSLRWLQANVDPTIELVPMASKHVYIKVLDPSLEETVEALRKPYPKRPKPSSEVPGPRSGEGGAIPTRTLQ